MTILETELIDYQLSKEELLKRLGKAHHKKKIFLKVVFLPAILSVLYMIYKVITNFNTAINQKGLLGFIFTESGVAIAFLVLCTILLLYLIISILVRLRAQRLIRKFRKSYDNNIERYEQALTDVKWMIKQG